MKSVLLAASERTSSLKSFIFHTTSMGVCVPSFPLIMILLSLLVLQVPKSAAPFFTLPSELQSNVVVASFFKVKVPMTDLSLRFLN